MENILVMSLSGLYFLAPRAKNCSVIPYNVDWVHDLLKNEIKFFLPQILLSFNACIASIHFAGN